MLLLIAGAVYFTRPRQSSSEVSTSGPLPASIILKGNAVEGAVLTSIDSQGRRLTLKVQDVERDAKDAQGEVYLYTVVYQNPSTAQWQNICKPDRDRVAKAIPLSGQWDARGHHIDDKRVTFACTDSALAKCVRWGYKPWKTLHGRSLRDFHQACTRMVRADYCGNGVAHTRNGTEIDIYDPLGIQKQVNNSGMVFEAAWGAEGAVAISRTRFPETLAQIRSECPDRLKPLNAKDLADTDPSTSPALLQQYAPKALVFNDSFVKASK
ncbi:MAG TPA: ADYC domain-containing protein [Stenomitos sp.]